MKQTTLCLLGAGFVHAEDAHLRATALSQANPIRKVVTLLQDMTKRVTAEGKKEADMYEKFMCYCKEGTGDLDASIEAATSKIASLTSSLKEANERNAQTEADLKEHTASRDEAKDTLTKATALRKKEAGIFAKFKSDSETNLAALVSATAAVEKGMAGAFLQTNTAKLVRQFAMDSANLPDATRDELLSFLSGGSAQGYAPQSGEIVGILKTLHDEMTAALDDATKVENDAIQNYEALSAAKKKEISSLQKQIETEMKRNGELDVKIAEMTNDKEDTEQALSADEKFRAELKHDCATKTGECYGVG
jgi:chromosome segregation ATPase